MSSSRCGNLTSESLTSNCLVRLHLGLKKLCDKSPESSSTHKSDSDQIILQNCNTDMKHSLFLGRMYFSQSFQWPQTMFITWKKINAKNRMVNKVHHGHQ